MGKQRSDKSGTLEAPAKRSRSEGNQQNQLLQTNPYATLSTVMEESDVIEKKVKVPPFFTTSKDIAILRSDLLKKLKLQPVFKMCHVGIKIICPDKQQYQAVEGYLKTNNYEYFTHDIAAEKPFKVVLRGLPPIEPEDIKTDLEHTHRLCPIAVFPMNRHNKSLVYRDSLYLVHFKRGSTNLASLKNIRAIFSIVVKWEQYKPQHCEVTQCSKCLNFGHGTKNCHMKVRCDMCAGSHPTVECELMEENTAKCANCGGDHRATTRSCPKRAEFIRIRKNATTSNQPQRRKVPPLNLEEFPPLPSRPAPILPTSSAAYRLAAAAASPSVEVSANSQRQNNHAASAAFPVLPSAPGLQNQKQPASEDASTLYSSEQLLTIFTQLSSKLRGCKSRYEQITALGMFLIEYGL